MILWVLRYVSLMNLTGHTSAQRRKLFARPRVRHQSPASQQWLYLGIKTYAECWKLQPEKQQCLEYEVPREKVKNHSERNALEEDEESENNPICEPLHIFLAPGSLQCLEGKVGRKGTANEIRSWCSKAIDGQEKGKERDGARDQIILWDLSSLLNFVHKWVLCELLRGLC